MKIIITTTVDNNINIVHETTTGKTPNIKTYTINDFKILIAKMLKYYGDGIISDVDLSDWNNKCSNIYEYYTQGPQGFDDIEKYYPQNKQELYDFAKKECNFNIIKLKNSDEELNYINYLMNTDEYLNILRNFYYNEYVAQKNIVSSIIQKHKNKEEITLQTWKELWDSLSNSCSGTTKDLCTYTREKILNDMGIFIPEEARFIKEIMYDGCELCPAKNFHYSKHYEYYVNLIEFLSMVKDGVLDYEDDVIKLCEKWVDEYDKNKSSIETDPLVMKVFNK